MFLIRDWKNLEYPYGFTKQTETSEAHSDYLEDVLEYKGCSEEHKDVFSSLRLVKSSKHWPAGISLALYTVNENTRLQNYFRFIAYFNWVKIKGW